MAEADLKILDPIWTTAYLTRNHGYLVYDTLFGTDENIQIKPQMVDRTAVSADGMTYTFTLRDGLRWHDGQPVVSEDCVESLKRWGRRDRFGQLLWRIRGKSHSSTRRRSRSSSPSGFGPVLDALGKPSSNVPFMMPARIASTPAEEQIKEVVGSGPFKFAMGEWQPGEQVVYLRNPDYIPREEAPSGSSGGKKVYLDEVTSPTPGTRRTTSRRARWTGGSNRRSTSSPRSSRTRTYRRSCSIPAGRKAGSGRTASTRRSTTGRRARQLAHGLIRASFVPDAQTQEMRNLLRTRKQLVREQSSHVLRVQKTLEDANIKLDSVLTDLMGKSGRAIIEALIAGETNRTEVRGNRH